MTVYWVDPHVTTSGTGTFASPYSINSSTRATLVAGDEVRIKGVALSSLLTATVYTATWTSSSQLTITAGGGLGADFAAGDVVYLPDVDAFFKVGSVSTNVIQGYNGATTLLPWYNSTAGQTAITVRRVNLASYPAGSTGAGMYIYSGSQSVNNITISDCWIDAVTRVTDGTVKTLIHSSSTASAALTAYIDGSSAYSAITTSRTYDLANTHILSGNAASYITTVIYAAGVTATIAQICGSSYTAGQINIGSTSFGSENVNVTIKHYNNSQIQGGSWTGSNITLTFNKISHYAAYYLVGTSSISSVVNCTVNINDVMFSSVTNNVLLMPTGPVFNNIAFNFNGLIDFAPSISPSTLGMTGAYGNYSMNYGASFAIKYLNRTSTLSSIGYLGYFSTSPSTTPFLNIPTLSAPSGYTVTTSVIYAGGSVSVPTAPGTLTPTVTTLSLPSPISATSSKVPGNTRLHNTLVVHRDGSAPMEILGISSTKYGSVLSVSYGLTSVVTTDATTYRTTGPSLKSNLTTRSTTYWNSQGKSKSTKSIKIPVTAGVAVTVSGYVRSDIATYATGDCTMRVAFNDTDLGSVAIASAYNAWAPFSISFTPTYTGEAVLLWEMYYAAAGNYWLDDLTF